MSQSSLNPNSESAISVDAAAPDVLPAESGFDHDTPTELVEAWMQQWVPNDLDPSKKAVVGTLISRWLEQTNG